MLTAVAVLFALLYAVLYRRMRRGRVGASSAGIVYDMLNQDRRHAVEIIVEEKAAERDPEDREGNLPELARSSSRGAALNHRTTTK
jgi:hypothetical protein